MDNKPPVIKVQIIISNSVSAFNNGTIYIYLEDLSRADAGALILAEESIRNVIHEPRSNQKKSTVINLDFPLKSIIAKIDPKGFYNIRVWIDVDSDGENSSKDLISDQGYRVLTFGFGNQVEVNF